MIWLEMSRDLEHGGGDWGYGKSLWSPTQKTNGHVWSYWELMKKVEIGDVVVHLRGKGKNAGFEGYSIASSECDMTEDRPPLPKNWSYSPGFYRIQLDQHVLFEEPIQLYEVFSQKSDQLTSYVENNREKSKGLKKLIFCVIQAGQLQCQNGAYLSEMDLELFEIIFGSVNEDQTAFSESRPVNIRTSEKLGNMKVRIGQKEFSNAVISNYEGQCCFPDCQVTDKFFLTGAHIARWADEPDLRGEISNGLSLCLMHDRAFERGMFVIDFMHRIRINYEKGWSEESKWVRKNLVPFEKVIIKSGSIMPDELSLVYHWNRVGWGS